MRDLGIYECRGCEMKTFSQAKLWDCPRCGGTMDRVGQLQRSNPTQNEITRLFEEVERICGDQKEDQS